MSQVSRSRIETYGLPQRSLLASAIVRAAPENVAALRKNPGPTFKNPIPPKFLRHVDDQTVVGLSAVLQATADNQLTTWNFQPWGVVAGAAYIGRVAIGSALRLYEQGGPRTVLPHLIPQMSLHAISGAISVALKMQGPNLGIGGGPGCVGQAIQAALTCRQFDSTPGVWLVLTQWEPEHLPQSRAAEGQPICYAVAMALGTRSRLKPGDHRCLRMTPSLRVTPCDRSDANVSVAELAEKLERLQFGVERGWSIPLWPGMKAEFSNSEALRDAA